MKPVGRALLPTLVFVLMLGLAACGQEPPPSPTSDLSSDLREAVTVEGVMGHARRLQAIADEHGGNRAAGTPGYDASADYVANKLRQAGYEVTVQQFEFPTSAATLDAQFRETNVTGAREYELASDFSPMEGTAGGDAQATLRPVDSGPTSGCEMEDFDGFPEGSVALLRRGTCTFGTKGPQRGGGGRLGSAHLQRRRAGRGGLARGARQTGGRHPGSGD